VRHRRSYGNHPRPGGQRRHLPTRRSGRGEYSSSGNVFSCRGTSHAGLPHLFWLDQNDQVTEAGCLIAEADYDAREGTGSPLGMALAIEVWHRARRVVGMSANKPAG
jgi:hypothetical protein